MGFWDFKTVDFERHMTGLWTFVRKYQANVPDRLAEWSDVYIIGSRPVLKPTRLIGIVLHAKSAFSSLVSYLPMVYVHHICSIIIIFPKSIDVLAIYLFVYWCRLEA